MLLIIWILLGLFLQSVQSSAAGEFDEPINNGVYPFNEGVPVSVNFEQSFDGLYVDALMKCELGLFSTIVRLTPVNFNTTILPPMDYIGQCIVNGYDQNGFTLTSITIQITIPGFYFFITSPSTTSPHKKYPAGSSLFVSWAYDPPTASTTTVTLTCDGPGGGTSISPNVASLSDNLTITTDSCGSICTLSLTPSDPSYALSSPIFVTVTQQLSFTYPMSGQSYSLSDSNIIPVLLITEPSSNLSTSVNLFLQCSSGGVSSSPVMTNYMVDYDIDAGLSGLCTLTPLLDSPDQDYLVAPSSTMSFYLKYSITFASITLNPVAGGSFSFQMDTGLPGTADVSLICGNVENQWWLSVPVNTLYTTALNSDVPTRYPCFLQTSENSKYYFQTNSYSFKISPNTTITITSPSASAKIASGSSFNIAWTTSSTPPDGAIFTASLACPEFSTLSSNTSSFSASILIPSIYYGDSCTISVAATGFSTAQVLVVVTQILSFETPTDGDVVFLKTSSFPVKLITSGANVYANVSVSFQCVGSSTTTSDFAANTDLLTQSVLPSQFGSCYLTIKSGPAYLVYPSPAVSFTLQYTLTFAILPTALYLNQLFTIQINTTTPASNPPSVTLYLICFLGLVSDKWPDVVINQPNSLLLSSDVPLESCVFRVNSSISYK